MLSRLFENNNVDVWLLTLVPVLIYVVLLWLITHKFKLGIKFRQSLLYMFLGTMSVFLVQTVLNIFPNLHAQTVHNYEAALLIYTFCQVAIVEELSKLGAFSLITAIRGKWKDGYFATMFYMMMVGLGFHLSENIPYGILYGNDVVLLRNVVVSFLHIIAAGFTGYFLALGRSKYQLKRLPKLNRFFNNWPKIKLAAFSAVGVLCGALFHGLHNYNFTKGVPGFWILGISFLVAGAITITFLAKKLIRMDKEEADEQGRIDNKA